MTGNTITKLEQQKDRIYTIARTSNLEREFNTFILWLFLQILVKSKETVIIQ